MIRFALVGAGSVGKSFLAGLPRLREQLGPVAAASTRLASRIANTLGAGTPVNSLDDLDACGTILLCPGGRTVEAVAGKLRDAKVCWAGKILLLCDSKLSSDAIPDFRTRGAACGSIDRLGDLTGRFVVEGDGAALRVAKYLAEELGGKPIELRLEKALSYRAALTFSSGLFMPLIEGCVECLQDAGIPAAMARQIAESLFQRSLRDYMHAGRKGWFGTATWAIPEMVEKEIEGLRASKPLLAAYYRTSAMLTRELCDRYPELARRLKNQNH
ncbi:MAG: DUF2520 domain-containing protein [Acidobacteriota bacterium]|nr:DUF2520 domain-containing protein [Acidobacteriota bacterium]